MVERRLKALGAQTERTKVTFLAPAGTSQDIVRKLNGEINRILQAPDVRERLAAVGAEPTGGTREQFADTIKADTVR